MFGRQTFQVAENVWCVRRPSYVTCSYAVKTQQGIVLLDAGMDSSGSDIEALLAAMGEPLSSVSAILLTHWHNDHAAGTQAIQSLVNCPVYCHPADKPALTREAARGGLRGWIASRLPEWGIFVLFIGLLGEAVPNGVTETIDVHDGDRLLNEFEVIETPGHTPGHVSFYHRPTKALFAGDALAVINGQVRFMARPVTLDLPSARESMQLCLDRDIQLLFPGHREPLADGVAERCAAMRKRLADNAPWPLFG